MNPKLAKALIAIPLIIAAWFYFKLDVKEGTNLEPTSPFLRHLELLRGRD